MRSWRRNPLAATTSPRNRRIRSQACGPLSISVPPPERATSVCQLREELGRGHVADLGPDALDPADRPGADQRQGVADRRVEPVVKPGGEPEPQLVGPERQHPRLVGVDRQRLLAEDVLARLQGQRDLLEVVGVGRGDDDGVDPARVERVARGRHRRGPRAGRDGTARGEVGVGDGDQPAAPARRTTAAARCGPEEPRPHHQEPDPPARWRPCRPPSSRDRSPSIHRSLGRPSRPAQSGFGRLRPVRHGPRPSVPVASPTAQADAAARSPAGPASRAEGHRLRRVSARATRARARRAPAAPRPPGPAGRPAARRRAPPAP